MLVTDATGQQVWSTEYTPFGKQVSKEGELDCAAKFTGKDLDEDTGLYYFNARWYDQEVGRFISEDKFNDPNNPNLYVYCANNPLINTDPSGNLLYPILEKLSEEEKKEKSSDNTQSGQKVNDLSQKVDNATKSESPDAVKAAVEEVKQTVGATPADQSQQQNTDNNKAFWDSKKGKWIYPLETKATLDPTKDGREFGADRDNGRKHAGVDFIAPVGTNVISMSDETGEVIATYDFWAGTQAVEVKYPDGTIIRYTEIKSTVKVGDKVNQGEQIGEVIANTKNKAAMLHLEIYKGTASGSLTNIGNSSNYDNVTPQKYQRRKDLIDPTSAKDLELKKK